WSTTVARISSEITALLLTLLLFLLFLLLVFLLHVSVHCPTCAQQGLHFSVWPVESAVERSVASVGALVHCCSRTQQQRHQLSTLGLYCSMQGRAGRPPVLEQ